MKKKLLFDSTVYIISPIALFNFIKYPINNYFILPLVLLIVIYTIITKHNEYRINLSGILFASIYFLISIFRQNIEYGFNMYIYDTNCMVMLTLIIILSILLNKNILKLIYIDINKCSGYNNLRISNNIKKANLDYDFKKISYLIIIHIISLIFIRLISIYTLGITNYEKTNIIQIIFNIAFIIGEIYMVSKLISNIKDNIKIKKRLPRIKKSSRDGCVIYIEDYKKMNS